MMSLTPEEKRKLSQRNWTVAAVLVAFVVLVYVVTIAKLGGNVMNRPL